MKNAFVKEMKVREEVVTTPTWDDLERAVRRLQDDDPAAYIAIYGYAEDVYFVTYYVRGLGYYFSGSSVDDSGFSTLVEGTDESSVEVFLAGEVIQKPRKVFVSSECVLTAAKAFYEQGIRAPCLGWMPEEIG